MNDIEILLIKREDFKKGILKQYGAALAAGTDLVVLSGGVGGKNEDFYTAPGENNLRGRTTQYFLYADDLSLGVQAVEENNAIRTLHCFNYVPAIRPVLEMPDYLLNTLIKESRDFIRGVKEVDCGEYPQYVAPFEIQKELDRKFENNELEKTGNGYTININYFKETQPVDEYQFEGKKYIRVPNFKCEHKSIPRHSLLSNGEYYIYGEYVWVEVSPVTWFIDMEEHKLISKRCLLAGIPYDRDNYKKHSFKETYMYSFLKDTMLPDILQNTIIKFSLANINIEEETINKLERELQEDESISSEELALLQEALAHEKKTR